MGIIGTYDPDRDETYCKLCHRWLKGKPAWGYRSHTKNEEHRRKLEEFKKTHKLEDYKKTHKGS